MRVRILGPPWPSRNVDVLHECCASLDISKKDAKARVRTLTTKRRGTFTTQRTNKNLPAGPLQTDDCPPRLRTRRPPRDHRTQPARIHRRPQPGPRRSLTIHRPSARRPQRPPGTQPAGTAPDLDLLTRPRLKELDGMVLDPIGAEPSVHAFGLPGRDSGGDFRGSGPLTMGG